MKVQLKKKTGKTINSKIYLQKCCLLQISVAGVQTQLKDLVCNASLLKQFLTVDGGESGANALQTQLCGLPADVLQEAERLFLTQLDFRKIFTVTDHSGSGNRSPTACVYDVSLCFLPERAADGQRWGPEERQPGRHLSLAGNGRCHWRCEETLHFMHQSAKLFCSMYIF